MKTPTNSPKANLNQEAQTSAASAISAINLSLASLRDRIKAAKAEYAALDATAPDDQMISVRTSETIKILADEAKMFLPLELAAANVQEFSAQGAADALSKAGSAQFFPAPNGSGQYVSGRLSPAHWAALIQPEIFTAMLVEAAKSEINASGAKQGTFAHVESEKARLIKEIESLSAQEEQWLRHADAVGLSYDRREDADPAAVLATDDALEAMIIH